MYPGHPGGAPGYPPNGNYPGPYPGQGPVPPNPNGPNPIPNAEQQQITDPAFNNMVH